MRVCRASAGKAANTMLAAVGAPPVELKDSAFAPLTNQPITDPGERDMHLPDPAVMVLSASCTLAASFKPERWVQQGTCMTTCTSAGANWLHGRRSETAGHHAPPHQYSAPSHIAHCSEADTGLQTRSGPCRWGGG